MFNNKKIRELVKLMDENPNLEVVFMANYEIIASDEPMWWHCEINDIKIDDYYFDEDQEIVITGQKEIAEHFYEKFNLDGIPYEAETVEETIERFFNEYVTKKIIVYLNI